MAPLSSEAHVDCTFCAIINRRLPVTIVAEDRVTIAFMDLRQYHPGHVLVVPRRHIADIRDADDETAAAVLKMVARVSRVMDKAFSLDGLSVWHSAGAAANQEVLHLHFHVHPRLHGDGLLRVYPTSPAMPTRDALEDLGARLRALLEDERLT